MSDKGWITVMELDEIRRKVMIECTRSNVEVYTEIVDDSALNETTGERYKVSSTEYRERQINEAK